MGIKAGRRTFEGALACQRGNVRVRLVIDDWDFLSYPRISLLDQPRFLPNLMPHVDATGGLCYFSPGTAVLDRYDPEMAIGQCLEQAKAVLDRIGSNPDYRVGDIQDEFLAHWLSGQNTKIWPVLIGTVDPRAASANYALLEARGERRALIASDPAESELLAKAFGGQVVKRSACPCWLFASVRRPAVPQTLPENIKELFTWLQLWDRSVYNQVQRVLERERSYLNFTFATFAVKSPVGWLGFGFDLDSITRRSATRRPAVYKQHLHGRGGTRKILRLAITDISPDYVHSRNLTFPDLRGKGIALVGCGAIGSMLSHSLVRLGAGAGGGSLTLIDPDTLQPENLGRHLLGYPALFRLKADAVCEELRRAFPLAAVIPVASDFREHGALFQADLIIDATGEEAVSECLNGFRLTQRSQAPMLHVWIRGNGESVQALWVDRSGGGCFRCLRFSDQERYRQERFPVLKVPPVRRFVGCHAFTPFAISAAAAAAALGTDIVIDWLKGDPSPRFRTRCHENADLRKVKNQDISKLAGCPACSSP
jgi:hypothetical protein